MDSCYEIIPLLERYASHREMTDAELARVRLHLIECDRCRVSAVPEHKKISTAALWPRQSIPPADVKASGVLIAVSLTTSLLLHVAAAVGLLTLFHTIAAGGQTRIEIDTSIHGAVVEPGAGFGTAPPSGPFPPSSPSDGGYHLDQLTSQGSAEGALTASINIEMLEHERAEIIKTGRNPFPFAGGGVILGRRGPDEGGGEVAAGVYEFGEDILASALSGGKKDSQYLVIWLIDRTPGMLSHRDEIISMVRDSYIALDPKLKKESWMTVVAFGRQPEQVLYHNTQDVNEVLETIESITVDPSGVENASTAIRFCTDLAAEGRSVRIILFTDERGDDLDDRTMNEVLFNLKGRRSRSRLYLVCFEVPFGVAETFERTDHQMAVRSTGIDSPEPEVLGDWGQAIPTLRPGAIGSGFGPFELTYLATESSGRVCLANIDATYNLDDLASMAPRIVPREQYRQENKSNRFRSTIHDAVADLAATDLPRRVVLRSDAEVAGELLKTSAALDKVQHWLPRVQKESSSGQAGEKKEKRWRANGDLLLAELTAAAYYLEARKGLLAAAGPIKAGQALVFLLEADAATGSGKVKEPANRLKRYRATPWARIGAILSDTKTLTLVSRPVSEIPPEENLPFVQY